MISPREDVKNNHHIDQGLTTNQLEFLEDAPTRPTSYQKQRNGFMKIAPSDKVKSEEFNYD